VLKFEHLFIQMSKIEQSTKRHVGNIRFKKKLVQHIGEVDRIEI